MAKAIVIARAHMAGSVVIEYTVAIADGRSYSNTTNVPMPFSDSITAAQANNFLKNQVIPELLDLYQMTFSQSDIIIIGGAI